MTKLYLTTHIPVLNTQLPFTLHTLLYITKVILHSFLITLTSTKPIPPTDNKNYRPPKH